MMLTVLNVCHKDYDLAILALEAAIHLDGQKDASLLLCAPHKLDVTELSCAARKAFKSVSFFAYDEWPGDSKWPVPQNHAWQQVARHIQSAWNSFGGTFTGWLWWEPDAVPLRKGWLSVLTHIYERSYKLFAGVECQSLDRKPYMNGVGIWPMQPVTELANSTALFSRSSPFDVAAAQHVMRSFKPLNGVMLHFKKESGGEKGKSFSKAQFESLIEDHIKAVFYHGCTDGTLHALVAGRSGTFIAADVCDPVKTPDIVAIVPRGTKSNLTFYHSGDIGDLVYALPLIKSLGGGTLFLGPYLPNSYRKYKTRIAFDASVFAWMESLLKSQPYLIDVRFTEADPKADYDLNRFRETWFDQKKKSKTLVDAYFERFSQNEFNHLESWLTVAPFTLETPVVIHRSSRYRNKSFPWREICGYYAGKMTFVGMRKEFDDFIAEFGPVAKYYEAQDALGMARVIAACELFIGNQSFPNSLALALRKPVIQETCVGTPDCVLVRPENSYCGINPIVLQPLPKKYVSKIPEDGQIILGPCDRALGLGDLLMITPVAKQLGMKATIRLPYKLAHFAAIFDGLCNVQLCEDFPVWPDDGKRDHMAIRKLRHMGLSTGDHLPNLKLSEDELHCGSSEFSTHGRDCDKGFLAFCPTCAKGWESVRMKSIDFWADLFEGESRTILQFGRKEYPLLKGAVRMPFYTIRELAAVYAAIGNLVSVDTGDLHLMLAVGGSCFAACPQDSRNYCHSEWHYQSDRVTYSLFENAKEDYRKMRNQKV